MVIVLKAVDISFKYFYFLHWSKRGKEKVFFCILQEMRLMKNHLKRALTSQVSESRYRFSLMR